MAVVSAMEFRDSASTQLPKAVIASITITFFNIYTEGMTPPIRLGTEFLLYTLAIFVGFVVFTAIWDAEPDNQGT